jgi:ATP-dependent DNA helicase RecG
VWGVHDDPPCPRRFAGTEPLSVAELRAAPVRYPNPAELARPLSLAAGARALQAAARLGLHTIADLLEHTPRDRLAACAVAELAEGQPATILVEVKHVTARPVRGRGRRPRVEALVGDGSGTVRATFFNQPWLAERYRPGARLMLHGRPDGRGRFAVQAHAVAGQLRATVSADSGAGVGHYPATEGISSTQILAAVREHEDHFADVLEPLPARLRVAERLLDRPSALRSMHLPLCDGAAEQGRRRLAFDELLRASLALEHHRRNRRLAGGAPKLDAAPTLTSRWLATQLPFTLTDAQRAAIHAIDADLASGAPMRRLLLGEVGSGKTVVALHALLRAVEHGYQAALMAPTETLAEQHFRTIAALLGSEAVAAGLLTGSTPGTRRADLLGKLASGELALVVGTHALIQEGVRFRALALVVVDEQHRFGVEQRAALAGSAPGALTAHELHMTATPIPRTLALSRYSELDVTELRELPRGRLPVSTHLCCTEAERHRAYARMREEVEAGRQAFIVCPLVESSDELEARAATAEYERLKHGPLAGLELVLMHGQMPAARKQEAMARFVSGQASVLVATTVVEVGVDVPNATVMLIEDADRYGISQLHQLRGRVGRGRHRGLCLLFGRRDSRRLRALVRESDGFRLAEIDLALRGHGELVGTRQSGRETSYRFADLTRDQELQERALIHSRRILERDPALAAPEHALLAALLTPVSA